MNEIKGYLRIPYRKMDGRDLTVRVPCTVDSDLTDQFSVDEFEKGVALDMERTPTFYLEQDALSSHTIGGLEQTMYRKVRSIGTRTITLTIDFPPGALTQDDFLTAKAMLSDLIHELDRVFEEKFPTNE